MSGSNRVADAVVTMARSAFAAVPYVGGLLNEVAFDHRARTKQRRMEEFVAGLSAEISLVRQDAIDMAYLRSDNFGDLLEATLRRVVTTGGTEKRERLRRVLVRQMQAPIPSDYQDLFLDLISAVTEKEIEILGAYQTAFRRPRAEAEEANTPKRGAFREPASYGLDAEHYLLMVQHLVARGLMYDDGVGRWDTSAQEIFEISELGRAFLEFIDGRAT
jgi:hypothetical protein